MSSNDPTSCAAASGAAATGGAVLRQAEQYLESAGLRILDRNWRCADGRDRHRGSRPAGARGLRRADPIRRLQQ
jgi:hypothetical protein